MELVLERSQTSMEPIEAIAHMMSSASIGPIEMSRRLGRSRGYVSTLLAQKSVPRVDTLTRIAHECGYRNVFESDTDRFEVYTDADNERRLRRMLEERPVGDGASGATDVPATPSVDDVTKAWREGRFHMVDGTLVLDPGDDAPSE